MNRIAIISTLFGCMLLTSGCIEVSHKSEWSAKLNNPFATEPIAKPVVDNGYPNSPVVHSSNEPLQSYDKNRHTMSPIKPRRKRGFTAFKRRER